MGNAAHQRKLVRFLAAAGVRLVIVNGVVPGSVGFARAVRRSYSPVSDNSSRMNRNHHNMRVSFVYHGSVTQHHDRLERTALSKVIEGVRDGVIHRLGFVKMGLAEMFNSMDLPAHWLYNFYPIYSGGGGGGGGGGVDGEAGSGGNDGGVGVGGAPRGVPASQSPSSSESSLSASVSTVLLLPAQLDRRVHIGVFGNPWLLVVQVFVRRTYVFH
jgi:hypothetical protein